MATTANAVHPITEKLVTSSDGTQIYAEAAGESGLPTIVLIHGFGLSALVFAKLLRDKDLLQHFHLIAYDLRGHGRSGMPNEPSAYTSKCCADDFISVTKAFNVKTPPILLGWSLGGSVAADVLEHYGQDALAGMITAASFPYLDTSPNALSEWVSGTLFPGFLNQDNVALAISTRLAFTRALFNNPDDVPSEVLWSWFGSSFLRDPAHLLHYIGPGHAQDTTNLWEAAKTGKLPLLVVEGDADKFTMNSYVRQTVDGKFSDIIFHTVKGGSHSFFYERQEEFVDQVLRFALRVFGGRKGD
ncbi:hypothetical protein D9611_003056 [Ephemerocybe angulata]|uniref:AB hydrolase-1 domain-containing protein n=1 Tax=Ephemerocybe angulata TaxID=980116 RepID=A0A8H5FHR9_9AGAR|nr:hypothetical protein D9611_003056 [Tulosesus angulatus]